MPSHDQRALEHLRELGCRPAAPLFEQGPTSYIREVLAGLAGVDSRIDDFGNVIAHYANGSDASQPPIAFVAHMDHPGFEIVSARAAPKPTSDCLPTLRSLWKTTWKSRGIQL